MVNLSFELSGESPEAEPDYQIHVKELTEEQKEELAKLEKKFQKNEITEDSKDGRRRQLLMQADFAFRLAHQSRHVDVQMRELDTNVDDLLAFGKSMKATAETYSEDLSASEQVVKRLSAQNNELQKALDKAKAEHELEVEEMQERVEKLEDQNYKFVETVRNLQRDITEQQEQIMDAHAEIKELQAQQDRMGPDQGFTSTAIHGKIPEPPRFSYLSQPRTRLSQNMTSSSVASPMKIKAMEIRKFSGEPGTWKNFWSAFQLVYETNPGLSDANRLTCLKTLLEGVPLRRIQFYEDTDEDYINAVRDLQRAYASKGVRNAEATTIIEDAPRVQSTEDLVNFFTEVKGGVSMLTNQEAADVLVPRVSKKLPEDMRIAMAQRTQKTIASLSMEEFLKQVRFEMEIREGEKDTKATSKVLHTSSLAASTSRSTTSQKSSQNRQPGSSQKKKQCPFCKGKHYPTHCFKVMDHKARMKLVESQNLCPNCLQSTHELDNCPAAKRGASCFVCQEKHHSALHGFFVKPSKGSQ